MIQEWKRFLNVLVSMTVINMHLTNIMTAIIGNQATMTMVEILIAKPAVTIVIAKPARTMVDIVIAKTASANMLSTTGTDGKVQAAVPDNANNLSTTGTDGKVQAAAPDSTNNTLVPVTSNHLIPNDKESPPDLPHEKDYT